MAEATQTKEQVATGPDRKPSERRFTSMKAEFQSYVSTLKDIKTYIAPQKGFFDDQPNKGTAIDHKTIIDGYPRRASRTLASGMSSGMTSAVRPWFKLGVADQDLMEIDSVKFWLDTVEERIRNVYSRSNIYGALTSFYGELGDFATAAMGIVEDPETVIRARNFTIGEYYFSVGPDGRVNGFARRHWMTAGQLVKEFGEENVSAGVKSAYSSLQTSNVDRWFPVIHLIEENDTRIPDQADFKNMRYRSVQWEDGSPANTYLRIGGYEEFPILGAKWGTTTTADIYGNQSPGWDALGDSKGLQKLQKQKFLGLDKKLSPPVQKDALVSGEVNTLPNGITSSSASVPNAGLRPVYQVDISLADIEVSIEKTQAAIGSTYFMDLFLMISQSDRRQITAEEIAKRYEEKLLMLGPVLDVLEDFLDQLIDRTFAIMLRLGLIPEPPEELQGQDLKVEYVSILAQAQKAVGTAAIAEVCGFVGQLVTLFPGAEDKLDIDEAIETYADMKGIPARIIRSAEAVAAIREAKQEALLKQQQAQAGMLAAQGAETLSKAKLGDNTVLDAVIKTMTGKDVAPRKQPEKATAGAR
jgi:hypothetical protein